MHSALGFYHTEKQTPSLTVKPKDIVPNGLVSFRMCKEDTLPQEKPAQTQREYVNSTQKDLKVETTALLLCNNCTSKKNYGRLDVKPFYILHSMQASLYCTIFFTKTGTFFLNDVGYECFFVYGIRLVFTLITIYLQFAF